MLKTFLKTVVYGAGIALGGYLMTELIDRARSPYHRARFKRKFTNGRHKFKVIRCKKEES